MDTLFMTADEVAEEMNVSKAYAYKVIQRMNAELAEMGYYTVSGKVNRKYFMKKVDYCDGKEKSNAGIQGKKRYLASELPFYRLDGRQQADDQARVCHPEGGGCLGERTEHQTEGIPEYDLPDVLLKLFTEAFKRVFQSLGIFTCRYDHGDPCHGSTPRR